ncbi:MAG: gamma carbonic anhydrase family protein [Alphaproteobacteria bacterium]|nr:gamma carbonic anhydrase family protein [Alphaproteobacteria bacterium]
MNDAAGHVHPTSTGGLILPYKGARPTIGRDVFIAPTATVIGNVTIGDGSNVWFNVLIRGDDHWIKIGERTNLQDGTVVHLSKDSAPTFIGSDITIGHGAIIHGCTLYDRCMIGIGAIVLDGAMVETGAIVGAGAVVPPGKRVPAGEMWAGCPAKKARDVRPEELRYIDRNAAHYRGLAGEYLKMRRALVSGM